MAEKKKWTENKEGKEGEKSKGKPEDKKRIQVVRVAETNLNGDLLVKDGIRKVRGVGHMMASAIAHVYPHSDKRILDLSEKEIEELEEFILNPQNHGIPVWQLNRRKDPITGKDGHIAVSNLQLTYTTDLNKMKKLRSYKGIRHSLGLPVRGQRTRGSFRTGKTVGVSKKKEKPAAAAK